MYRGGTTSRPAKRIGAFTQRDRNRVTNPIAPMPRASWERHRTARRRGRAPPHSAGREGSFRPTEKRGTTPVR